MRRLNIIFAILFILTPAAAMLFGESGSERSWIEAVTAFDNGKWDESRKNLDELKDTPDEFPAGYLLNEIDLNEKKFGQSEENINIALEKQKDALLFLTSRSLAAFTNFKVEEAEKYCVNSLSIRPDSTGLHLILGIIYDLEDKFEESLDQYNLVLKDRPDYLPAEFRLGMALAMRGYYSRALPHLEKYAAKKPRDISAAYRMGRVMHVLERYEDAVFWYYRTLDLTSRTNPKLVTELAGSLAKLGRYREALELLENSLKYYPLKTTNRENSWTMCMAMNNLECARYHAMEAIKTNPDIVLAYYQLGIISRIEGKIEEAKGMFDKTPELDPRFENAKRAKLELETGSFKRKE